MISILIAATLLVQSIPPASTSTRVAGRVVNSINGDPVADAVVILRTHDPEHSLSYADTTDAKGHFSIGDVAPGEYGIDVERAGFVMESAGH